MKINLNETELHQAIEQYIENEGIDLSKKVIDIQLTAGRSPKGFNADVVISDPGAERTCEEESPFKDDENKPEAATDKDQKALVFDD